MQKYYSAIKDNDGDYVTSNDVRYTVKAIDPARVHIPAGREGDMVLLDTQDEFLTSMGLEHVDDHTFAPIPEPEPIPESVPQEVAAWAIKAQLELDGDVDAVEGYLATIEGAQGIVARRAYEGNVFLRNTPPIAFIQALLSKTDAEVDALFIAANKLVA